MVCFVKRILPVLMGCTVLILSQSASALTYIEAIDGAVSSDISNPTILDFDLGSNEVTLNTDTAVTGADFIAFTLSETEVLTSAFLLDFSTLFGAGAGGFLGIIDATNGFPSSLPASAQDQMGMLMAGLIYGEDQIEDDLLKVEKIVDNEDVSFLTNGTFLFWFNETSDENTYTIDFNIEEATVSPVPVPAAMYLLLAPLAAVLRQKKLTS